MDERDRDIFGQEVFKITGVALDQIVHFAIDLGKQGAEDQMVLTIKKNDLSLLTRQFAAEGLGALHPAETAAQDEDSRLRHVSQGVGSRRSPSPKFYSFKKLTSPARIAPDR